MSTSADYVKIVAWSDEDGCFVGSAPGFMYGGCHGGDEVKVFKELCEIVVDIIGDAESRGEPLPPPTAGQDSALKSQQSA